MQGGFTKGLIVGSIIGASMGMMMENGDVRRKKRRMMKNGRDIMRNTGHIVNDVVRMFR